MFIPQCLGAAAHLHWRLYATGNSGGSLSYIGEVELRATVGGADETSSGMTCNGSYSSGPYLPANSVDNTTDTQAAMNYPTVGEWLSYTFATAIEVKQVAWYAALAGANFAPSSFELQYSDDGSSWTTVQSWTPTWVAAGWYYFTV